MTLSDIYLDDGNIALVTSELRLSSTEGNYDVTTPVKFKGNMMFYNQVWVKHPVNTEYVTDPRPPTPASSAAKYKGLQVRAGGIDLGGYGSYTEFDDKYSPINLLRGMKAPFDLYYTLELMRRAIIDLYDRK